MIKRFFLLINSIILAFMFIGCGGGSETAPEGAEITFSSGDIEITDGSASTVWDNGYVNVIVKNAEGIPLDNVKLVISYPWAAPSPGIPGIGFLVQLYDGDTPKDSPMTVQTDEYGTFYLRYGYLRGGLEYFGDLSVVSGSASASIEIKLSVPSS